MIARIAIALALFLLVVVPANAEPEDMAVSTWEAGCEHTMTTNHFELGPGQSVQLELDLSGCGAERLGGILYFGYKTTRNSSKPLVPRDRMRLRLVDNSTGASIVSDDGSVFTQIDNPGGCTLYAENMGRKTIKIRLRSSSGL